MSKVLTSTRSNKMLLIAIVKYCQIATNGSNLCIIVKWINNEHCTQSYVYIELKQYPQRNHSRQCKSRLKVGWFHSKAFLFISLSKSFQNYTSLKHSGKWRTNMSLTAYDFAIEKYLIVNVWWKRFQASLQIIIEDRH